MKKILLLSAAVLSILAAVSCAKEEQETVDRVAKTKHRTVLSATLPSPKTALGDLTAGVWPNYWKTDDQIIVNGVTSEYLEAQYDGQDTATFTFDELLTQPYYAAYPVSAVSDYNEGTATVTLPAVQSYVEGSYDPEAFILCGQNSGSSLSLDPKVSIIHLSFTGNASICRIKLTGGSGTALSGTFSTDFVDLTPVSASNVVELKASDAIQLPADFFITVPVGLVGALNVAAYDTDGGKMSKNATVKSALTAGQVYSPSALAYTPSYAIEATAEGITSSTAIICWDNCGDSGHCPAYTVSVYSDAGCNDLVASYAVPAGASCWGGETPRFCVSGLDAGTTYYVKVTNETKGGESNIVSVTTADFNIVQVSDDPADVDEVILAEDFGELRWDSELINGGVGYFPTEKDTFSNSEVDQFLPIDTNTEETLGGKTTALILSRLAHWAQGANNNLYIHPGYIKLVGSSKVTHLVTPALNNIPDGKTATLEVEITACPYYSESNASYATLNAIVAVQHEDLNELTSEETKTNTLDLTTNVQPINLDAATEWKTYKVTINGVVKGDRLAFGAHKDVTKNNARMNISDMKVTIKALNEPGDLVASVKSVSSSTAAFSWTHLGASVEEDINKPYMIALYSDENCEHLVVSHVIALAEQKEIVEEQEVVVGYEPNPCWHNKTPGFIFGGLDPDTEYWFVATDMESSKSTAPVSATTETFTVVDAAAVTGAVVGDVILAEDFSEIGAGPDEMEEAAGFVPSNKTLPCSPTGITPDGSFASFATSSGPYGDRIFDNNWNLGSSRLSGNWGFFGNSSSYYGAGYLRLSSKAGRTHVVTPALSGIPAGKSATIEVTVTACKYESSVNDIAVFAEKGLSMNSTSHKYSGASLAEGHGLGITATKSWTTKSVTINNVDSDHHLIIGSLNNIQDKNRFYISDVVVTIVSLKDQGSVDVVVDINDFTTLKAFLNACEPGIIVQGNLMADIDLTPSQVEEIDALYPIASFEGIINGNNHTIAGLTKPLIATLKGTVNDLTLNSTLNITAAMNSIGILAGTASNANISGCVTNGSVALDCTSEINGDLSIAGMVGLNNGGTMTGCVNNASVTNASAVNGEMRMGGLVGLSYASLSYCNNTGDITNNGSTFNKEINVAGVVGICYGNLTSCSNGGNISNSATSGTDTIQDSQIGGVVGNNKGDNTWTSCFNTGAVTNSGAGAKISIGGLAGWSSASTTYTSTCYNTGFLTNTGTGSSNPGLCMGGLLGVARGANTLTGTASVYNYNQSVIVDDSGTLNVAVGGICGYSDNAPSSFDYCKSLVPDSETDYDDIEIKNNTKNKVYVGGIIGRSDVASTMDYTYNKSDIKFTSLAITETGQVFGGGIIGGWGSTSSGAQTITGCENNGWVYTKASAGDLAAADSDALPKYWSCFAGIAGMGAGTSESLGSSWYTITGKTFTNCTNTGTVRIYAALRCCIAGVVAYTENNPDGCVSTASDIRPFLTGGIAKVGDNYHRNICGGVVGLCTASKVSNLKSTAKIVSQSSSPFAYTGGIIGYVPAGTIELENCKVSNHVQAAGSGDGRSALMCHVAQNAVTVTFTNCVVKNGTISYSTGKKVTISSSNLSALHCVGPGSKYTITDDVLPSVADSI